MKGPDESPRKAKGESGAGKPDPVAATRFREGFFQKAEDLENVIALLSSVPASEVFVKDNQSRYVYGSEGLAKKLGLAQPESIVLSRARDYFPPRFADHYEEDDKAVFESGKSLRDKLNIRYLPSNGFEWVVISKFPVLDGKDRVIGIAGACRTYCRIDHTTKVVGPRGADPRLAKAIDFLVSRVHQAPTNGQIASAADVSLRQLGRLFRDGFQTTPGKFASYLMLERAFRRLLESNDPLVDIALDLGFGDQSSFTAHFRKLSGMTPRKFRLRWAGR